MNILRSASMLLTVISLVLTILVGLAPPRIPLWIPVLLLAVAMLVGSV